MSKIVTMTRSLGEYLPRYDGVKFVDTDGKTVNDAIIVVPDKRAELIKRVGKYKVEDNLSPTEVIKSFAIGILPTNNIHMDDRHDLIVENQDLSSLAEVNSQKYQIISDITKLNAFEIEGVTHKWVAIAIDTGETTVVGMKLNGKVLTKEYEDYVKEIGYTSGVIIYWYAFETDSATITISKDDKSSAIDFVSIT